MNDVRETFPGKFKAPHVAAPQADRGVSGQVRRLDVERFRRPREHRHSRIQVQRIACPYEAFQQPAAEKAGTAGDEQARPAQLRPDVRGVSQNVVEVALQGIRHRSPDGEDGLAGDRGRDGFDHVVDHFAGDTGVDADKKGVVHDAVGFGQRAVDAMLDVGEARLAENIAAKDHAGFDLGRFQFSGYRLCGRCLRAR